MDYVDKGLGLLKLIEKIKNSSSSSNEVNFKGIFNLLEIENSLSGDSNQALVCKYTGNLSVSRILRISDPEKDFYRVVGDGVFGHGGRFEYNFQASGQWNLRDSGKSSGFRQHIYVPVAGSIGQKEVRFFIHKVT